MVKRSVLIRKIGRAWSSGQRTQLAGRTKNRHRLVAWIFLHSSDGKEHGLARSSMLVDRSLLRSPRLAFLISCPPSLKIVSSSRFATIPRYCCSCLCSLADHLSFLLPQRSTRPDFLVCGTGRRGAPRPYLSASARCAVSVISRPKRLPEPFSHSGPLTTLKQVR